MKRIQTDWKWKIAKLGKRIYIRLLRLWVQEQIRIDGDEYQVKEILNEWNEEVWREVTRR